MSQTPIAIRSATTADAALLTEFGRQAFVDAFAADNNPGDMADYVAQAFNPARQQADLADPASHFLIAEIAGETVGYVHLKSGSTETSVTGHNPIELVRIYTDPDRIGQGIGAALMTACLEVSERNGHDVIWLGVWEYNQRAQAFYQRWGFGQVGTHIFQLGSDAQTDWIMQRPVQS